MLYTIGEMAEIVGVAPSTLRYYEKEGLIPFVERSAGGVRMFKEADRQLLRVITCLKATGMPLCDIREFVYMTMEGDATIDARLELFEKRREAVRGQLAELEQILETVEFKCWYYETARAAGTTAACDAISLEDTPERFRAARERLASR